MLAVIPFGGDATTAGASERRVQGLHDAHDVHDGVIVSYRDALCIVVPCYAIGIHWDPLNLSACRFAPPFAMLK